MKTPHEWKKWAAKQPHGELRDHAELLAKFFCEGWSAAVALGSKTCGACSNRKRAEADLRRLVEEAQDRCNTAVAANAMCTLEINRLKGELAEARDCGSVCGVAGQQCQECLRKMFHREVARREMAMAALTVTGDWWREEYPGLDGLAAPPAEQAQGEGAPKCLCGGKGWPRRAGPPTKCSFDQPCAFDGPPFYVAPPESPDPVAELAKRVEELAKKLDSVESSTASLYFTERDARQKLSAKVDRVGAALVDHEVACGKPAPPPPEAAGPGPHAFEEKPWGGVPFVCYRPGCWKGRTDPIHAAPPIPEGLDTGTD